MIIGLSGLKGSGKDTVAAHLVKEHGFERRAFADPLKRSCGALLDIPFHEIERYKNDETVTITLSGPSRGDNVPKEVKSFTFRQFLQRYGTEAHRDIPEFGTNIWLDQTLPVQGYYEGRNIVVSDVRFPNEAKRVHELKGIVVVIHRMAVATEKPEHRSEQLAGLYENHTIFNNGDIADLCQAVDLLLDLCYKRKEASG